MGYYQWGSLNGCVEKKWKHFQCDQMFKRISSTSFSPKSRYSSFYFSDLAQNLPNISFFIRKVGKIFKFYLVWAKIFNSLWHNLYVFGQIFIAIIGQILKTQAGHLVTLIAGHSRFAAYYALRSRRYLHPIFVFNNYFQK